jgi:MFS transporter, FHS family, Na+ dependent glucose transporter 1
MTPSSTTFRRANPIVATIAYYLAFIILGMTTAASGPSLLKLAEHTSSGLDRISLIFIFGSLGYLIGSYLGGRAFDRFSSHKLLSLTVLLIAVASLLIPNAHSMGLLLFAMFLSGFASGIIDVGGNALLIWTHGEKSGPFLNGLHFFFGVGSLIAPLVLARVLLLTGDINWMYYFFAIVSLPLLVWFWFLPEPPKPVHTDAEASTSFPVRIVVLTLVLFFLYVGLELGFGNWIYTYALTLGLGTTVTAAYLTSAFWGSFTFGRLLAVWISTRMRPVTIIVMDLIGCVLSTMIIMLWRDSNLALWIGTMGLGISMASIFPTIILLAGERMRITGTVTGWFLVGSGAGSMLLPWLIGQIFARTGPQAMTTVLLVDIVLTFVVLFLFTTQRMVPLPDPVQTN